MTKETIELLVNQPWSTLLLAASGYAAYYVANVGIREHHKLADITFSTLVFAFVAAFAFYFGRWILDLSLAASSNITFLFAIACWRCMESAWTTVL